MKKYREKFVAIVNIFQVDIDFNPNNFTYATEDEEVFAFQVHQGMNIISCFCSFNHTFSKKKIINYFLQEVISIIMGKTTLPILTYNRVDSFIPGELSMDSQMEEMKKTKEIDDMSSSIEGESFEESDNSQSIKVISTIDNGSEKDIVLLNQDKESISSMPSDTIQNDSEHRNEATTSLQIIENNKDVSKQRVSMKRNRKYVEDDDYDLQDEKEKKKKERLKSKQGKIKSEIMVEAKRAKRENNEKENSVVD